MDYNFVNDEVTILKYGNGHIVSHTKKLEEKINGQDYLLDVWYFQDNYGNGEFLVGTSIDNNTDECIQSEIYRMMNNEYLPEIVWRIDDEILRKEQAPPYGSFKGVWKPPVNPNDAIIYDFKKLKIIAVNYRNGKIVAFTNPYRDNIENKEYLKNNPEENKDIFMLHLWYFQKGYGIAYFLFGVSCKNNNDSFVKNEILSYLKYGGIEEDIDFVEEQIDEIESFEYDNDISKNNFTNFSLN